MTRFALAVLLAACGNKPAATPPVGGVSDEDLAIDNHVVPEAWRARLQFVAGTITDNDQTFALAVPRGWKRGLVAGALEPADSDGFGSKTFGKSELRVGSGCNGACEPKDWAAAVDEAVYKQYGTGALHGRVIHETKGPDRRSLIFEVQPEVTRQGSNEVTRGNHELHLITTWWTAGDSKYYECRATLGEPSFLLVAAFDKACAKVLPQ